MDYDNPQGRARPPLHTTTSTSTFSRISSVSDISDFPTYDRDELYDYPPTPIQESPGPIYQRDNVSAQSRTNSVDTIDTTAAGISRWPSFTGYFGSGSNGGGRYEQVSATGGPLGQTSRQNSRSYTRGLSFSRTHATIAEEGDDGIDLGLINHAAPMGAEGPYSSDSAFDSSLASGTTTSLQRQFTTKVQQEEMGGKLTGGLGSGIRTETTMRQSELLATSPVIERAPSFAAFNLSRRQSALRRAPTLKQLGQSEANKRGEVIEVIMEDDGGVLPAHPAQSEVDLSIMTGPNTGIMDRPGMRQSTLPTKSQRTEVFYPQPDWKPFSMRWPYLLGLILLSVGLGGAQEVVYQMSARKPLLTFHTPAEIPPGEYFAFKFLPTLITVSFGVLWQLTDFEVKRLEAFYQLSKEGGALAAESINVDYITFFSFLRPFRALHCKHYAVAISSVATLFATALVPTLGAASINLSPSRDERMADPFGEKSIVINALWSRFLTVTLFIIALLGCVLFYQLQSRRSGLLSDVKGIAGLASMAVVSHILMDFKDMDVATHKDIHHKLKNHRYVLRNSSLAPDDDNPASKQERDRYTKDHLSENPHPRMLRFYGATSLVSCIIFFLILIPTFLFTPATIITDKAPWVPTALAVCIKLGWGGLETDIRMMEPYYILSRRHAPPKTLTLDYTAMPFGWAAFNAFLNAHWLVLFVGLGTIMAEFLTVLVTSLASVDGRDFVARLRVPECLEGLDGGPDGGKPCDAGQDINAGQETMLSFWISLGLAVFVLVYMGIVAAVAFVRRRKVFLPRQPNTIASVLAFIHQSKMLYDFVGTAKLNNAEMVLKLDEVGKTYGLGWFQGRDGQPHCGVDEEELLSRYKFGYDYSKATNPWEEREVEWL